MHGKSILIVEDERVIAEDIRRTLQALGYQVVAIVSSGEQAVAKTKEFHPNLVLMDIMLEGEMNGMEAGKIIHEEMGIPIIFLTAYSNDKTLQAATAAEPYGYILKPFEDKELYATIEMAFYKFKIQTKLRENEKKYRDIFENANEAICVFRDGIINFLNPKTLEYFGYSRDYLSTIAFSDLVYFDDREELQAIFTRILEKNDHINAHTFRIIDKSNNIHWIKFNAVPINWEGHPAILAFMNDITNQIKNEEEIKKFKIISDNANYGIAVTDINGNIEYINQYFSAIHGYQVEELIGKNLSVFYDKEQRDMLNKLNQNLIQQGSYHAVEMWHTHKDTHKFPMLMNCIIIRSISGNQQYIATSAIDITDRKNSEKVQQDLMKELEHVNNELQNFAYVISHDLKAPLRAISTLANWITADYSDKFDDEGKEQMRLLITRVKRMHDLIDGVLEYSRVGRIREEKVDIDLNSLVPEIIETLAPPKNMIIKINNELPVITFEKTRITQVFQNLLSNAIKFMDKPQGIIQISSENKENFWKFSIGDNGPGIERKHFAKIFTIFQTLQPRDEFESTGIGLTLIKKIIDMYEGSIWLDSEIGKGTTFHFTIPKNLNKKDKCSKIKSSDNAFAEGSRHEK